MKLTSYIDSPNKSKTHHEGELFNPSVRYAPYDNPETIRIEFSEMHPNKRNFRLELTKKEMLNMVQDFMKILQQDMK